MTRRRRAAFRIGLALVAAGTLGTLAWLIHPTPSRTPWCASLGPEATEVQWLGPRESATVAFSPAGDHLDWLRVRFADEGLAPACSAELTLRTAGPLDGDPHERTLASWTLAGEALAGWPEVELPRQAVQDRRAGEPLEVEILRRDDAAGCALGLVVEDGVPSFTYGASEQASLWGGRRSGGAPSPWIVLGLLAVAALLAWRGPDPERVAELLAVAPSQPPPLPPWTGWDWAAAGGLTAAALAALLLHPDYPITWDEPDHAEYGRLALAYYTSGLRDTAALTFRNNYLYGAGYDLLGALWTGLMPAHPSRARHLLGGLVGLVGIVACWRTARALAGPRAGLWAVLLLLATPIYVGHAFNNPKDIPFAAAYALSMLWMVRVAQRWPAVPWWTTAALGASIGLACGVRIGGLLLGAVLLGLGLGHAALTLVRPGSVRAQLGPALGPLLRVVLPALVLAYAVMLACWPWAQHGPLTRPWIALGEMSHFAWDGMVLYRGQYPPSAGLPGSYAPTQLLLQLPEVVLPALALAVVAGLASLAVAVGRLPRSVPAWGVVAAVALLPVVYIVARGSVLYDGARHLLFVVPPLVVVAAAGLERVWCAAAGRGRGVRVAVAVVLAAALAHPAWVGARMHPYPHSYYNRFVGGPRGAAGRYVLEDWRSANAEGVAAAVDYLEAQGEWRGESPPVRLYAFGEPRTATAYAPPGLVWEDDFWRADLVLVPSGMPYCQQLRCGDQVAEVRRVGVPLVVLIDRRERTDGEAECATAW